MTNNDDDGPYGPSAFALGVGGDLRRTDEWDKFYSIRLSVTLVARWYLVVPFP